MCEPKQKKNNIRFREKTQKYFRPVDGKRQRRLKTMSESTFIKSASRVCRYNSVKCCCMEAEAGGRKKQTSDLDVFSRI